MKDRISSIAETTKMLPPPVVAVVKAIDTGVGQSKDAAQKGIQEQSAARLVAKHGEFCPVGGRVRVGMCDEIC